MRMNNDGFPRRSKQVRTTDTKDRLLGAARRVVLEDGLGGATSRHITDLAGVNLAAVTYHFGSKDELIRSALAEEIGSFVEPALAALEGTADPVARLLEAVQLLLSSFATHRGRVPLYLEAAADEARSGVGATGRVLGEVRARVAEVVAGLRGEGAVPDWVDPDAMAALLVATAQGIVVQGALDPEGPDAGAQAAQLVGLLLAAQDRRGP